MFNIGAPCYSLICCHWDEGVNSLCLHAIQPKGRRFTISSASSALQLYYNPKSGGRSLLLWKTRDFKISHSKKMFWGPTLWYSRALISSFLLTSVSYAGAATVNSYTFCFFFSNKFRSGLLTLPDALELAFILTRGWAVACLLDIRTCYEITFFVCC